MFTPTSVAIGVVTAYIVGVSKTALPGAGLVVAPLMAIIVTGRALPGATVPLLLAADVFAIAWYRRHARWDLLRRLTR